MSNKGIGHYVIRLKQVINGDISTGGTSHRNVAIHPSNFTDGEDEVNFTNCPYDFQEGAELLTGLLAQAKAEQSRRNRIVEEAEKYILVDLPSDLL